MNPSESEVEEESRHTRKQWHPLKVRRGLVAPVALAGSYLLVAYLTLQPNLSGVPMEFSWCIVCGSFGTANFLLNILLFVPLGAALRLSGTSWWLGSAICLASSIVVEMLQLTLVVGRHPTFGDIISNLAGGGLGFTAAFQARLLLAPARRTARWLAFSMCAIVAMGPAATVWLFEGLPTHRELFSQVASRSGETGRVFGTVQSPTANGAPSPDGYLSPLVANSVEAGLERNGLRLAAVLTLTQPKTRPAKILRLADADGEEIAVLGLTGLDAFFSVRTRAASLKLQQPSIGIANALRCDLCARGFAQGAVTVSGERRGATYELTVADRRQLQRASVQLSPNSWWLALWPTPDLNDKRVEQRNALVLFALFSAIGYWLGLSAARAIAVKLVLSVTLVLLAATQIVMPLIFSLNRGSMLAWTGAIAGSAVALLIIQFHPNNNR